tara:strand:- start:26027 stop:26230 length:204 start_codon:yes stop_codon:yes gene_type:complete
VCFICGGRGGHLTQHDVGEWVPLNLLFDFDSIGPSTWILGVFDSPLSLTFFGFTPSLFFDGAKALGE